MERPPAPRPRAIGHTIAQTSGTVLAIGCAGAQWGRPIVGVLAGSLLVIVSIVHQMAGKKAGRAS